MLEKLMTMYTMQQAHGVRSPIPHLFGPAGSGKSSSAEALASVMGVQLHIINVNRLSPLDVEGLQMPDTTGGDMALRMLTATHWTQIREGDIVLFEELLECKFPEVFAAIQEIVTARRVGGYCLPSCFMMAASNDITAPTVGWQDRLLHMPVADPRKSKRERNRIADLLVDETGLMPTMAGSDEMAELLTARVLPMFDVLDRLKKDGAKVVPSSGDTYSVRNLIGQVLLRYPVTPELKQLITVNNMTAMNVGQEQYVVLLGGGKGQVPNGYAPQALRLRGNPRLTEIQAMNLELNLQLIELEEARRQSD
jgi:hypothetical protein